MTGDRDKKSSEMKDRMAGRFSDDKKDDDLDNLENSDNPDNLESSDNPDNSNYIDNQGNSDNLDNSEYVGDSDEINKDIDPKENWTGRMVYVPDGTDRVPNLLDAFDGEYQRFEYECDWDIRKQKHYYPVVIRHGINDVENMSGDEFTNCVDELNLR